MKQNFLSKKSWHTGSFKHMEKVWVAEQKNEAEQKRIDELQKELQKERQLQQLRADVGLAPTSERLDWMYDNTRSAASTEEYLTQGKAFTGHPEEKTDLSKPSLFQQAEPTETSSAQDMWNKVQEDPLFSIRKQEQLSIEKLKKNPIRMRQIMEKLSGPVDEKKKREKEEKKRRKQEKKEKKLRKKEKKERKRRAAAEGSYAGAPADTSDSTLLSTPSNSISRKRTRSPSPKDRDRRRSRSPDERRERRRSRSPDERRDRDRRRSRSPSPRDRDRRRSRSPDERRDRDRRRNRSPEERRDRDRDRRRSPSPKRHRTHHESSTTSLSPRSVPSSTTGPSSSHPYPPNPSSLPHKRKPAYVPSSALSPEEREKRLREMQANAASLTEKRLKGSSTQVDEPSFLSSDPQKLDADEPLSARASFLKDINKDAYLNPSDSLASRLNRGKFYQQRKDEIVDTQD